MGWFVNEGSIFWPVSQGKIEDIGSKKMHTTRVARAVAKNARPDSVCKFVLSRP